MDVIKEEESDKQFCMPLPQHHRRTENWKGKGPKISDAEYLSIQNRLEDNDEMVILRDPSFRPQLLLAYLEKGEKFAEEEASDWNVEQICDEEAICIATIDEIKQTQEEAVSQELEVTVSQELEVTVSKELEVTVSKELEVTVSKELEVTVSKEPKTTASKEPEDEKRDQKLTEAPITGRKNIDHVCNLPWMSGRGSDVKPKINTVVIEVGEPVSKKELVNNKYDVKIKTYGYIQERRKYMFRVTSAISPSEFYMELLLEGSYTVKGWYALMQKFYNNGKKREEYKTNLEVYRYQCYVYFVKESNVWERVRAHKVTPENHRAKIYFMDLGTFEWVTWNSLYMLAPKFTQPPAFTFLCRMADIRPTDGQQEWSNYAKCQFQDLTVGQIFHTIVVSRVELDLVRGTPENQISMSVVLVRRTPLGKHPVQAELIIERLAEGTGVMAGFNGMLDIPESGSSFTKHTVDSDNRVQVEGNGTTANQCKEQLPEIFQFRLGFIKFTHLESPSCMYVTMQSQLRDLFEMEASLEKEAKKLPTIAAEKIHLSMVEIPVICRIRNDKNKDGCFSRGIVLLDNTNFEMLNVLMVDYGYAANVKYVDTCLLPVKFTQIPSFAHRIHLNVEGLIPKNERNWARTAGYKFKSYIAEYEPEEPHYFCWRIGSEVFPLDYFNQELYFDHDSNGWETSSDAKDRDMCAPILSLQKLKHFPMLRNLFYSIGVDIGYQIFDDQPLYKFKYLADYLVEEKFARSVHSRISDTQMLIKMMREVQERMDKDE